MTGLRKAFFSLGLIYFLVWVGSVKAVIARENEVVKAFQRVGPAVVSIRAIRMVNSGMGFPGQEFFDNFWFGPRIAQKQESIGSGVIIDPRGYILTNQHVIENASQVWVSLKTGKELEAEVIGADVRRDLAILKVTTNEPLSYILMGSSSDLMIGETVIAIGNPFGLGPTLTTGVVSALGRRVQINNQVYGEFIQTDASINPGNSGGALLNIEGELIGITTAIYANAQGIGFAIPIDRAKRVVDDLIAFREVKPGWLGIEVEEPSGELTKALGVPAGIGVMISKIWRNSPAEKAGLKPGLLIIALDSQVITSKWEFNEQMRDIIVNDEVVIKYLEQRVEKQIKLIAKAFPEELAPELCWFLLGLELEGGAKGVMITKVDMNSMAGRIGLGRGDLVLRLNQAEVRNLTDFYQALIRNRNQNSVLIVIKRRNIYYYVSLPLRS